MVIQVEKLSKQYGTNIVLDNIDVNMDEGVTMAWLEPMVAEKLH